MRYDEFTKDEQVAWLKSQIRDFEAQHFQQEQFAAMAEAAGDVPEPDEADQSPEAQVARQYRINYPTQAAQHRAATLEAERRIAALRAALSAIEGKAVPGGPKTRD